MSDLTAAFTAALVAHMGEVMAGLLLLFGAAITWAVSWLRAHTTASAVRQATDMAGGTAERERDKRASLAPKEPDA